MTLTEIQRALDEIGTSPSRSLGQNFLHDQNLAQWIVSRLEIAPGDHIVEIGPGLGALTQYLSAAGVRLTLLEKDGRLAEYLTRRYVGGTTRVFHGDALDFDLRDLWGNGPVKIVGNLPYYVSTPLIAKFTDALSPASMLVLTLQLELAQRLNAVPRTKDYGAMTVCVSRRWKVMNERKLPASVFFPAPKVSSAVITMRRRNREEVGPLDEKRFDSVVRRGFSERRKQLRNLLPEWRDQWSQLTGLLQVPDTVRAEELSLAQWEEITRFGGASQAQRPEEVFDIVNERNEVIGTSKRSEVHVNNFLHRAVHLLIFNQSGELFLQKRSMWKDKNPEVWDSSAAGHVDSGETYEQAAVREMFEEIGIQTPLHRIGRLGAGPETGNEFIAVYRGVHEGPFSLAPLEVETGAFFPLEQIRQWSGNHPKDFSPVFLQVLAMMGR